LPAPAPTPPVPDRETVAEFARIGITAFTTTRASGDFALAEPEPGAGQLARWQALHASLAEAPDPAPRGLVSARQVHGRTVAEHRKPWRGWIRLDGVDAHVVSVPGGAAAVTVADCVPVFIAHPGGPVCIVHAGWRGIVAGVLSAAIERVAAAGVNVAELAVHFGPAICGRCYEVGPDVYEQLTGWHTIRRRHVDLRALLGEQAKRSGVTILSGSQWCTRCDNDRFYSHRAGDAGRQVAVILSP
jgi:hypothetical protein